MNKEMLRLAFQNIYQCAPTAAYFSPGRVNLIGEHIDYHGGLVLPAAITIGIWGAIKPRTDQVLSIYSEGYSLTPLLIPFDKQEKNASSSWADYARGVIYMLQQAGYHLPYGFDLYVTSTMPTSGGLSSSSAFELLLLTIFNDLFDLKITKTEMALLGKKVENDFIGVLTGIMDQFVIAHGQKDQALLLNTTTLTYRYIPLELGNYTLLVANTNKKRGLADSKYNERFHETMGALKILQTKFSVKHLTELKEDALPVIKKMLDEVSFRRVKHVITEQQRTLASGEALKSGDIMTFARYLNGSHQSLKEDYEVTGIELDTLVDLCLDYGAIGARMTGAGFGGCAICLVKKENEGSLINKVVAAYKKKIGYAPTFYQASASNGTAKI
ncbi:MAG: galactokinase [Bacilli bacterium]